jgi:hypothetical protein
VAAVRIAVFRSPHCDRLGEHGSSFTECTPVPFSISGDSAVASLRFRAT